MRTPVRSPTHRERRAVLAVLAAVTVAAAGTVLVAATWSTATGYAVAVGEPVAEVPDGAAVVESDALAPALRRHLAETAASGRAAATDFVVDRAPAPEARGAAYVEYAGQYRPISVTTRRAVSTVGRVLLGLVYLLALLVAAYLPGSRYARRTTA